MPGAGLCGGGRLVAHATHRVERDPVALQDAELLVGEAAEGVGGRAAAAQAKLLLHRLDDGLVLGAAWVGRLEERLERRELLRLLPVLGEDGLQDGEHLRQRLERLARVGAHERQLPKLQALLEHRAH